MPSVLQVQTFFKQGLTGGAYEALTAGSGDSATLQTFTEGNPAFFTEVAAVDDSHSANFAITSLNMANTTLGLGGYVPAGSGTAPAGRSTLLSPPGTDQPVFPADTLTVQVNGTAGDNVNLTQVIYYSNLPVGVEGWLPAAGLRDRLRNVLQAIVQCDASTGTISQGDWSAPVALNASSTPLNASKRYALLGWTSDVPCAAVGVSAPETANRRVGGPSLADGEHDSALFVRYAEMYGTPLVPVINGANQGLVNVQVADPTATTVNLAINFGELR